MDVVLLGTGTPMPDPERAGASTLVRTLSGTQLLVDCGRAVVMRLAGAGVDLARLTALAVTHLHSDHTWALNDLLTTRWVAQFAEVPLPVVGPQGTALFVDRTLDAMGHDIGYRMGHHDDLRWRPSCEVTEVGDGPPLDVGDARVTSALVDHGVVRPALSYRIEADDAAVVVAGDTRPCAGLDRLCEGADVYVQTVLRRDLVEAVPVERFRQILDYHSSVEDAAQTAARAGVRTLVLTHLIPAPTPDAEHEWVDAAARHFGGEIVVGRDLVTVPASR